MAERFYDDPTIAPAARCYNLVAFSDGLYLLKLLLYGARYLVYIHTAGTGIKDLFVQSPLTIDLVGGPFLYYCPGIKDVKPIGINDLAYVVGYDYHRPTLLHGVNAGLDLLGGYGVQAGGGSSRNMIGGFFRNIRAIAMRCC